MASYESVSTKLVKPCPEKHAQSYLINSQETCTGSEENRKAKKEKKKTHTEDIKHWEL